MRRKPSSFVLVIRLSLRMGAGPAPFASGPSSSSSSAGPQGARQTTLTVWLPTPPDATGRTVLGEGTRPLARLTRESFYELSGDVDCQLRLVWADPRLAELTGHTLDELHELGGFFGLVAEANRADLQRRNQRLLAGQQVVVRYKLKRKDGTPVCVRDTARPEWGPDGEVVRILGAVVDLSAERAEAPVLQIVEREAQLVAAALDAFVVLLDAQGQIRWTGGTVGNGLAERLRDNVGQNLAALLPGQALLVWLDWLEEAAERKAPVRFRFTWTEDEGGVGRTPTPASGLAEAPARRFDDATAPGGGRELEVLMTAMGEDLVQVVLRGVVDRPPLARGGSVPSDLLDSLREPLLLLDPAWQIVTANDAFERLVGRVRAELAGTPVLEQVVTPGQRATVAEALTLVLAKRETTVSTGIRCLARGGGPAARPPALAGARRRRPPVRDPARGAAAEPGRGGGTPAEPRRALVQCHHRQRHRRDRQPRPGRHHYLAVAQRGDDLRLPARGGGGRLALAPARPGCRRAGRADREPARGIRRAVGPARAAGPAPLGRADRDRGGGDGPRLRRPADDHPHGPRHHGPPPDRGYPQEPRLPRPADRAAEPAAVPRPRQPGDRAGPPQPPAADHHAGRPSTAVSHGVLSI